MNRKLLFAIGLVFLFLITILVWYFFYVKPVVAPSLSTTNNPLPSLGVSPRFNFLGDTFSFSEDAQDSNTEITYKDEDPLIEIWGKPATGHAFITKAVLKEETATSTVGSTTTQIKRVVRATSTALLFVDRATGYLYSYSFGTKKTYQLSNSIIAGVFDAYIFNYGKRIIIRYEDKETKKRVALLATIPDIQEGEEPAPLQNITSLNAEVTSVAVNPITDEASYLVVTEDGSTIYSIGDKDASYVVSSPFREWVLAYGGKTLFATAKPSYYATGITVKLPTFEVVLGERYGLSVLPKDSGTLFASESTRYGITSFFVENGKRFAISTVTLAEKCAWSPTGLLVCGVPQQTPKGREGYPDDWYQGTVSFSDSLSVVEQTGESSALLPFPEKTSFDITHLVTHDVYIAFTDKNTSSLWLVDTSKISE